MTSLPRRQVRSRRNSPRRAMSASLMPSNRSRRRRNHSLFTCDAHHTSKQSASGVTRRTTWGNASTQATVPLINNDCGGLGHMRTLRLREGAFGGIVAGAVMAMVAMMYALLAEGDLLA